MATTFGELFDWRLWASAVAIVRYIPRSFNVPAVDGMEFYTEKKYSELRARIESMTPDSPRQWGTMSVAQMIHHLNLATGGGLGFYKLEDESYCLSRTVFRWILVDWFSEQPIGLRLPKDFVIPPGDQYDFRDEQARLLIILDKACHSKSEQDWGPHPLMGCMTPREWGRLLTIHIDYHLRQFAG